MAFIDSAGVFCLIVREADVCLCHLPLYVRLGRLFVAESDGKAEFAAVSRVQAEGADRLHR